MRSSFMSFNVAVRALMTQQKATDVTGHNIANANTPGFSRQRPVLVTTPAFSYAGAGQVGTGVTTQKIERIRDQFLDGQIWGEKTLMGYWEERKHVLEQVEILFMEPSDSSFNFVISRFWDSWQDLVVNPENSPVRTNLAEISHTLINTVNHINMQMDDMRRDVNKMLEIKVEDINRISNQVAQLNAQIVRVVNRGDSPNDLMDRRDLLIEELTQIADVRVVHNVNGSTNILLRGRELVWENRAYGLMAEREGPELDVHIYWLKDGQKWQELKIGRHYTEVRRQDALEGLDSVRKELTRLKDDFNTLVDSMAELINTQHGKGYNLDGERLSEIDPESGGAFFTKDDFDRWELSPLIVNDVLNIAASSAGDQVPGNSLNALEIVKMRNEWYTLVAVQVDENGKVVLDEGGQEIIDPGWKPGEVLPEGFARRLRLPEEEGADSKKVGRSTFESFYRDSTAYLGVQTQESIRMVENQETLITELVNYRESISGVSLDEEVANLLLFQFAYQSAARVVSTLDSMLDTVINRMAV